MSCEMFAYKEINVLILLNTFLRSFLLYVQVTDSERHNEIASAVCVILGFANPRR
jgi:hypothetical protein